jgi:tetratricopeptide (TPR) repeat protein
MRLLDISLLVLALAVNPMAGAGPAMSQSGEAQAGPKQIDAAGLDNLFGELRHQTGQADANRVARLIWENWGESGSATVNLLMQWAAEAMRDNKFAAAEDLLTQVVVLAPEFAEGWNRRATLYFMKTDYGRSISDIERTLQLEPRHFGALSGLGIILQRSGLDKKALDTWYRVLEIYPANEAAQKAVTELEEKLAGQAL